MEATMSLTDSFRQNLKEMLVERAITQTELANRLKCKRAYVSHLITGYRTPQLDTLEKLAEALQCEPADFLKEKSSLCN